MLPLRAADSDKEEHARPVKIIAHRGVNKFAPQNTLPAIELAIDMGLDFVEIDVRQTKDGELVLMHNSTVDGTTDGTGAVVDLTLEQIKQLDAGAWFKPEFKGTRVPTFCEALGAMKHRIGAYIDFKAGAPEKLVEAIHECGAVDRAVLYANPDTILRVQELDDDIRGMPHVDNVQQLRLLEKTMNLRVVETNTAVATKELVEEAHAHGIMVFMDILGLTDNKAGVKQALKLGVDAIQTDHPDLILKYLDK